MRSLARVALVSFVALGACTDATGPTTPTAPGFAHRAQHDEVPPDSTHTCRSGYNVSNARC